MNRIERLELAMRLDRGDILVVVEALPEAFYRKAHLPGAINIPHTRVDELAPEMLPDKQVAVVVYCSSLACENSDIAARRLEALGYSNVSVYAGGKQDWISAGLPVETIRTSPRRDSPGDPVMPVACGLDEEALAKRSDAVRRELFSGAVERTEIEGGYAFRFPGDGDWHARVLEFVASERRCCSFFRFDVSFEPELGPIWLSMTGPEGTRSFIEEIFSEPAVAA